MAIVNCRANALPVCRVCGEVIDRGRYCPPCDDNVREMVDESQRATLVEEESR